MAYISKPILETICMKYQSLFSGENKKNISKHCLVNCLPSMLSDKSYIPSFCQDVNKCGFCGFH